MPGLSVLLPFPASLGYAQGQDVERVKAHLTAMGMPASADELPAGQAALQVLIDHMRKDKKARQGKLTFILARQIGEAFVDRNIDEAELNRFLESL